MAFASPAAWRPYMGRAARTVGSDSAVVSGVGAHGGSALGEYLAAMGLRDRIREFIDAEQAPRMVAKYYGGKYTGALFDTAPQLSSPDPNRFTAHDVAAVAALSVPLSGPAVMGLFAREESLAARLREVPTDVELAKASDEVLARLFALQNDLDLVVDVGHVTRSKLLAHKRPHLVPIRDRHVLTALLGHDSGSFTEPLREALAADPSIVARLAEIRDVAGAPASLSVLRVLDVLVWMVVHGHCQVVDAAAAQND